MSWARDDYHEMQVSSYKPGRLNIPHWATRMLDNLSKQNLKKFRLNLFKQQNQNNWNTLSVNFLLTYK